MVKQTIRIKENSAKAYLIAVEEVKQWLLQINPILIENSESSLIDFECSLRNGITLAKLCSELEPEKYPSESIFDFDHEIYKSKGLVYKHTENLLMFVEFLEYMSIPKPCMPKMLDIYAGKSMAKLIFAIHWLAFGLRSAGRLAFGINSKNAKSKISVIEIFEMEKILKESNEEIPNFESAKVATLKPKVSNSDTRMGESEIGIGEEEQEKVVRVEKEAAAKEAMQSNSQNSSRLWLNFISLSQHLDKIPNRAHLALFTRQAASYEMSLLDGPKIANMKQQLDMKIQSSSHDFAARNISANFRDHTNEFIEIAEDLLGTAVEMFERDDFSKETTKQFQLANAAFTVFKNSLGDDPRFNMEEIDQKISFSAQCVTAIRMKSMQPVSSSDQKPVVDEQHVAEPFKPQENVNSPQKLDSVSNLPRESNQNASNKSIEGLPTASALFAQLAAYQNKPDLVRELSSNPKDEQPKPQKSVPEPFYDANFIPNSTSSIAPAKEDIPELPMNNPYQNVDNLADLMQDKAALEKSMRDEAQSGELTQMERLRRIRLIAEFIYCLYHAVKADNTILMAKKQPLQQIYEAYTKEINDSMMIPNSSAQEKEFILRLFNFIGEQIEDKTWRNYFDESRKLFDHVINTNKSFDWNEAKQQCNMEWMSSMADKNMQNFTDSFLKHCGIIIYYANSLMY